MGLAGWTIFLDQDDNGLWDIGEQSTRTLADDPATPEVWLTYSGTHETPSGTTIVITDLTANQTTDDDGLVWLCPDVTSALPSTPIVGIQNVPGQRPLPVHLR